MPEVEDVVLVTGVSGFIGSHVAKVLLENGYHVRGTVRSLENTAKVEPLHNLVQTPKYPLELVEADLTKDDGWDKALEGCSTVMHVASPFPNVAETTVKEEDLIVPAKEGTLRVLKAAAAAKVKKVVLTSSFAAVYAESNPEPGKAYSEEDWSDPDSPTIDPYSKSKVLAEKVAWDYLKDLTEEEKFDLVVINPSLVFGPALMESHKNATSVIILSQILNKAYPAMPKMMMNICDVRDVAIAHMKAITVPEAVGHRHIIYTDNLWMKDIAGAIAKEFKPQGYSIPTGQLPYFVCWLAGFFNKSMKSYIIPRIGKTFSVDNKRMVEVLGIQPTPAETSIQDMAYSLIDLGIVKKAKKYKQVGSRAEVPVENGEQENKTGENEEEKDTAEEKKELEPEDKEKIIEHADKGDKEATKEDVKTTQEEVAAQEEK